MAPISEQDFKVTVDPDGVWRVECLAIPDTYCRGDTREAAIASMRHAIRQRKVDDKLRDAVASMNDAEKWETIDELIFNRSVLLALKQIRIIFDCGLREAIDIVYERYDKLRRSEARNRFTCSADKYWEGFEASIERDSSRDWEYDVL